jgi:hypothetical protein
MGRFFTDEELHKFTKSIRLSERNKMSSELRMWVNAFPTKGEYTNGVIRAAELIESVKE